MLTTILTIIFWIGVILSAIIGGLGLFLFFSGASGNADPTDHGNIVAIQFGIVMSLVGVIIAGLTFLLKIAIGI